MSRPTSGSVYTSEPASSHDASSPSSIAPTDLDRIDSQHADQKQMTIAIANLQSLESWCETAVKQLATYMKQTKVYCQSAQSMSGHFKGFYEKNVDKMSNVAVKYDTIRNHLTSTKCDQLQQHITTHIIPKIDAWKVTWNEAKKIIKERNTARDKYNHYSKKLANLRSTRDKTLAKGKLLTAKENEKLTRNEKKFIDAQTAYRRITASLELELDKIWNSRYTHIDPIFVEYVKMETHLMQAMTTQLTSLLPDMKRVYGMNGGNVDDSATLQDIPVPAVPVLDANERLKREKQDLARYGSITGIQTSPRLSDNHIPERAQLERPASLVAATSTSTASAAAAAAAKKKHAVNPFAAPEDSSSDEEDPYIIQKKEKKKKSVTKTKVVRRASQEDYPQEGVPHTTSVQSPANGEYTRTIPQQQSKPTIQKQQQQQTQQQPQMDLFFQSAPVQPVSRPKPVQVQQDDDPFSILMSSSASPPGGAVPYATPTNAQPSYNHNHSSSSLAASNSFDLFFNNQPAHHHQPAQSSYTQQSSYAQPSYQHQQQSSAHQPSYQQTSSSGLPVPQLWSQPLSSETPSPYVQQAASAPPPAQDDDPFAAYLASR